MIPAELAALPPFTSNVTFLPPACLPTCPCAHSRFCLLHFILAWARVLGVLLIPRTALLASRPSCPRMRDLSRVRRPRDFASY